MRRKERGNDSVVVQPNHLPPAIENKNRAFFPIFKMNFHTSYSQRSADNFLKESIEIVTFIQQRQKLICTSHLGKTLRAPEEAIILLKRSKRTWEKEKLLVKKIIPCFLLPCEQSDDR
ncbi:hypothetical protein F7C95_20915 [Opitutia bacterium ISCC 51]|nr:hypothetical protein F7C95_20915 [Opitutae bacterium ISCC 51]QXD28406.1 hypothetical protein GA003_20820 [Opitutae bacterium ISCC 52]